MAEKTDTVPGLTIRRMPIDSLLPDPANARAHPEANLDAIAASLARFDQVEPVLVQAGTNRIVAGHGRIAAMRRLGWTECDAIALPLTDLDAASLAVALNRSAELAEWDESALAKILDGLRREGALEGVGFSSDEIDKLLSDLAALQPPQELDDSGPQELAADPVSRRGDRWKMGEHILLQGDACDVADYERLLQGERADMLWTDAPYGVSYTGGTADKLTIQNDDLGAPELEEFLRRAFTAAINACKPGAVVYACAPAGPQFLQFATVLTELNCWRATLVWVKNAFVLGHSDFHYRHENIAFGWTPGARHHAPPTRTLDSVWEEPRPHASPDHPCCKPVALVTRALEASSNPGDTVLDCFCGSGTAILGAEATRRRGRGIEIDPRYVDASIRRWQEATGEKAMLDGRSFAEVEAERIGHEEAAR